MKKATSPPKNAARALFPQNPSRGKPETREKIMDAAQKLFSARGFDATGVMDIVSAVGMSAGTFYIYFKDKGELFHKVAERSIENLRNHLLTLRQSLNIWDREDRIAKSRKSFSAFFDYVDLNREQMTLILRGSAASSGRDAFDYAKSVAADLAEDAARWAELGVIEGLNPWLFAHAALGMTLQVVRSYLSESMFTRREAIDFLLRMLAALFEEYLTPKGRALLLEGA